MNWKWKKIKQDISLIPSRNDGRQYCYWVEIFVFIIIFLLTQFSYYKKEYF